MDLQVHSIERGLPAIGDGFAVVGFKNLDAFGSALSTFGELFCGLFWQSSLVQAREQLFVMLYLDRKKQGILRW